MKTKIITKRRIISVIGIAIVIGALIFLYIQSPTRERVVQKMPVPVVDALATARAECDKRVAQVRAEEAKKCEDRLTAQKAVEEVRKEVAKTTPLAKPKPVKKVVVKTAKAAPAPPAPVLPAIPPAPPEVKRLTLRINIVEWSPVFDGACLEPRQIGPVADAGLTAGTVRRTTCPVQFNVNGAVVLVQGQAVLDLGPTLRAGTGVVIQPIGREYFVLPPGAQFPFGISAQDLKSSAEKGVSERRVFFILAPAAAPPPDN